MPEQWDLQSTDERTADQTENYIIFCEDEVSEPFYFNSFGIINKLKINTILNQKQSKLNLNNTIAHCRANGLIIFREDGYRVNEERNENIWCIYDRDLEFEEFDRIRPSDHIDFDTAIQTATNAGINVAWSNDAFELWVLLHFEEIAADRPVHRNYIYERLTAIFSGFYPDSAEYQVLIAHPNFNYKDVFKKRVPFIIYVIPLLRRKTSTAIKNALALEKTFGNDTPFHLRNPCTKVHHLVRLLLTKHV